MRLDTELSPPDVACLDVKALVRTPTKVELILAGWEFPVSEKLSPLRFLSGIRFGNRGRFRVFLVYRVLIHLMAVRTKH